MALTTASMTALVPSSRERDVVREAIERLAARLPDREDAKVLIDFLEDDLKEGLEAIADVEAHFTDILDTLRSDKLRPISLLECADDLRALQRLEYLLVVVAQLRRRLSQAAGKMRAG